MELKRCFPFLIAFITLFLFSGAFSASAGSGAGRFPDLISEDFSRTVRIGSPAAAPSPERAGSASVSEAVYFPALSENIGLVKEAQNDGTRFIEPLDFLTSPNPSGSGQSPFDPGDDYALYGGGGSPWYPVDADLDYILLQQPSAGKTVTQKPVRFMWEYGGDLSYWNVSMNFELDVTVMSNGATNEYVFYMPSSSCSRGVCTYSVDQELGGQNASVSWYVTAYINTGRGVETVRSDTSSFALYVRNEPAPTPAPSRNGKPEAPVQKDPSGTLTSRTTGFYWYPSRNAEYYVVNWWNDRGNSGTLRQNQTDSTCQMNLCIVKTTLPAEGNYSWSVTASNSRGSATSGTMSFRVTVPQLKAPETYLPVGSVASQTNNFFEWENVGNGATRYRLQVVDRYTGAAYLDSWYNTSNLYIGSGICYLVPNLVLPTGNYIWRVKSGSSSAESEWSSWREFTVYGTAPTPIPANTVPTPVFPTGTITERVPHYEWKAVTGAAYYQLNVYDAAGKSLLDVTAPASSCSTGTCSFSPNSALPGNGSYRWIVSAYGSNGVYWGYAEASFTLSIAVPKQSIVFITPENNGYLDPNTHKIIWADPGAAVTQFRIEIKNASGVSMLKADLTRENALCSGISCSIQFKTIPAGRGYRLLVTPYSGTTAAGPAASLIFSVQ